MSYYMADGTQIAADDPEPDVNELLEVIQDLMGVAQWYRSFYHDVQQVTPEYLELCADLNAAEYLYSEAANIRERAGRLISEWGAESDTDYEPDNAPEDAF